MEAFLGFTHGFRARHFHCAHQRALLDHQAVRPIELAGDTDRGKISASHVVDDDRHHHTLQSPRECIHREGRRFPRLPPVAERFGQRRKILQLFEQVVPDRPQGNARAGGDGQEPFILNQDSALGHFTHHRHQPGQPFPVSRDFRKTSLDLYATFQENRLLGEQGAHQ